MITADDVMKIQGDVASPAELKKQLDELKADVDKKFHATEHTRLSNRTLIMLVLGIAASIAVGMIKPYFEGVKDNKQTLPPRQSTESSPQSDGNAAPASPKEKKAIDKGNEP